MLLFAAARCPAVRVVRFSRKSIYTKPVPNERSSISAQAVDCLQRRTRVTMGSNSTLLIVEACRRTIAFFLVSFSLAARLHEHRVTISELVILNQRTS